MSSGKKMVDKTKYEKTKARTSFILQQFRNSCQLSNMRGLAMIIQETDGDESTHYTVPNIPFAVGLMIHRMIYDLSSEYEGEDKENFLRGIAGILPDGTYIYK